MFYLVRNAKDRFSRNGSQYPKSVFLYDQSVGMLPVGREKICDQRF